VGVTSNQLSGMMQRAQCGFFGIPRGQTFATATTSATTAEGALAFPICSTTVDQ
jgi:hypothetical protein